MSGLGSILGGLSRHHTRRMDRVSVGSIAIERPVRERATLRHPRAQLGVGIGFSLLVVTILAWNREFGLRAIAGSAILVAVLNGLFFAYLLRFRRPVLASRSRSALVGFLALMVLGLAGLHTRYPTVPHLVPITAATIVFAVVFDRRFALEASWMLLVYVAAILATDPAASPIGVVRMITVLAAGVLMAVLTTGRIRTRGRIIRVGAYIGVVHFLMIAGFHLALPDKAKAPEVLSDLGWGFGHGILVGFVVSGSLPLLEYLFGISTDISLLELSNISQQTVLRRLLVAAPGTYNHSFVVGMLAEEAAEAIGANPLLARVGGYYHDIGKMMKPEYFGENELIPGQHHRPLSPTMSTLILKSHVKDGAELGRHHDLPKPIIDIIEQHHGTTLIEYFHNKAEKRAREGERIEKSVFRYDGPRPQSPEAGIVMLADSVEAATRSLSDPTPARVESVIRSIAHRKLGDGQLDECGLTLKEVRVIEDSFIRVLAGIFHRRPRYPASLKRSGETPESETRSRTDGYDPS